MANNQKKQNFYGIGLQNIASFDEVFIYKCQKLVTGNIVVSKIDNSAFFVDSYDVKHLIQTDESTAVSSDEKVIISIMSEQEIVNKFKNNTKVEVMKTFYNFYKDLLFIGFKNIKNEIIIQPVDINSFYKVLEKINAKNIEVLNSTELLKKLENKKEKTEESFEDKIVIGNYEYEKLLKCNNLNQLISKLKEMSRNMSQIEEDFLTSESFINSVKMSKESGNVIDIYESTRNAVNCANDHITVRNILTTSSNAFEEYRNKLESSNVALKQKENAITLLDNLIENFNRLSMKKNVDDLKKELDVLDIKHKKDLNLISTTYDLINIKSNHDVSKSNSVLDLSFNFLDVKRQLQEKIVGRDSQISAILSVIKGVDNYDGTGLKPAILIAGGTGTGKTRTFNELKKALPTRPIIIVDTSQITQQGYKGGTLEDNILKLLINQAHFINSKSNSESITDEDIEMAKRGIVILDEIDKRAESGNEKSNVNCSGVTNQLLTFMENTTYNVSYGSNAINFETGKLVVMATGAFQEYFDSTKKNPLGFSGEVYNEEFKYDEIKPDALVNYGLPSQFVGRFTSLALFPPLDLETLVELELNPATSNIECARKNLMNYNVELVWDEEFIEEVAKEALRLKTGGRGLRNIIDRTLKSIEEEMNERPLTYKIVYLRKESVLNPDEVILIDKDDNIYSKKQIIERQLLESKRRRKAVNIKVNYSALEQARNLLEAKVITRENTFEHLAKEKVKAYDSLGF